MRIWKQFQRCWFCNIVEVKNKLISIQIPVRIPNAKLTALPTNAAIVWLVFLSVDLAGSYLNHFKNDTVIFWSTSEGNPAVRAKNGSIYLQYFFKCLNGLDKTDDIYDLQRWLNQCLLGKSYKLKKQKIKIMICPSMQTTLQKRLHL